MTRRLIADVDTGIDDMLALVYLAGLHRLGEVELAAVTATAGNTTVCRAAANSRLVLDLVGLPDVPVAAGYGAPLRVPLVTTPETHGEFGLGFVRPPNAADDLEAYGMTGGAPLLWGSVLDDGPCDLLITGPLTTAARHLDLVRRFDSLTVMGGALDYPGNTTPTAEWNFHVDPDAVAAVLGAEGIPRPLLCMLQVTETVTVDPGDVDRWRGLGLPADLMQVIADALRFYFGFHRGEGLGYLAQVHDLLAAMAACGTVDAPRHPARVRAVAGDRGAVRAVPGEPDADVLGAVDRDAVVAEFERALAALAM
ncbi:nucleoside hydrolase [Corynebacterium sp.]|uniref:nucleoside hydrolase n=1 Tax=Corynebacterium sp. TaxID=1720 RepID=UPI0026DC26B4|nr:nucleoside hydrolase [Corynebacterium sp.]MDO4610624.1 nucleoside hydrolase [Corynebacterium sp.]